MKKDNKAVMMKNKDKNKYKKTKLKNKIFSVANNFPMIGFGIIPTKTFLLRFLR